MSEPLCFSLFSTQRKSREQSSFISILLQCDNDSALRSLCTRPGELHSHQEVFTPVQLHCLKPLAFSLYIIPIHKFSKKVFFFIYLFLFILLSVGGLPPYSKSLFIYLSTSISGSCVLKKSKRVVGRSRNGFEGLHLLDSG